MKSINHKTILLCMLCLSACTLNAQQHSGKNIPNSASLVYDARFANFYSQEEISQAKKLIVHYDRMFLRHWKLRASLPLKVVFYAKDEDSGAPGRRISTEDMLIYNPKHRIQRSINLKTAAISIPSEGAFCSIETYPLNWYIEHGYLTKENYFYYEKASSEDKNEMKIYVTTQLKCYTSESAQYEYVADGWKGRNYPGSNRFCIVKFK